MKKPMADALWCDCETDEERANFIAIGRACETGIIAKAIQSELVNIFSFRAGVMRERRAAQLLSNTDDKETVAPKETIEKDSLETLVCEIQHAKAKLRRLQSEHRRLTGRELM